MTSGDSMHFSFDKAIADDIATNFANKIEKQLKKAQKAKQIRK